VEKEREITKQQIQLAMFAKALAHPVRIAILQMLTQQEYCFHGDMSEMLPVAKSTLSQHLKELKKVGLIQGSISPPMVKYCIHTKNWEKVKRLFSAFFIKLDNLEEFTKIP
jgi:predicted transcriptional regulator